MPEEIIELLSQGKITGGHARTLLSLDHQEEMIEISREIMDKDLSVRQTEKLTQKAKKREKAPQKREEKSNFLKEVELALTENLCRKISVTKKGDGGVLSIEFFSQEDLTDLANKLEEKE